MTKPTLAIDLDGTITEDSWPRLGDWMPGAVEALHYLKNHANIVVHTSRIAPVMPSGAPRTEAEVQTEINAIREKLDEAGLYTVSIHTSPWKPSAIAYVDNKAVHYNGRPKAWKALVPKLVNMLGDFEEAAAADDLTEVR